MEVTRSGALKSEALTDLGDEVAETRRLLAQDTSKFQATAPAAARIADDTGTDCGGFAVFMFGETRDRLGSLALRNYGLKLDDRISIMRPTKMLAAKCGFSFRDVDNLPTEFVVDHYPMGERQFQLVLLFNAQGKFYRVEFCETGSWGRDEYASQTTDRENFIADMFTKRFGRPSGGGVPAIERVQHGRNSATYWNLQGAKAGTEVAQVTATQYQVRGFIEQTKPAAK
jgi:hypothetical protein